MKFERMKLPVLTGMSAIEKYAPKTTIHLSSVRMGIQCLILNGYVCDITGMPFKNNEFQEDFKDFSERVNNCKSIVFGRIVDTSIPFKNYSIYELSSLQRLTYDSSVYSRKKESIKIEVEDIYCFTATGLKFRERHLFLSNIILSIKATNKKTNTEIQPYIILADYKKSDVDAFVLAAARRNEIVLFRDNEFLYSEGEAKLNECKSFYLNPFEEIEAKIGDVEFDEIEVVELKENLPHISRITAVSIGFDDVIIDFDKEKSSTRRVLYELILKKKISSIKFEAVIFENKLKFQRPL
jgi:hypothetical protein